MAIRDEFGTEIQFYDAYPFSDAKLFVHRDSMGIVGIVRAKTWKDAFEITRDEFLKPIDESEAAEAFDEDTGDLQEGYEFQSNATGTGIVAFDFNGEALDLLTLELAAKLKLSEFDIPETDCL